MQGRREISKLGQHHNLKSCATINNSHSTATLYGLSIAIYITQSRLNLQPLLWAHGC